MTDSKNKLSFRDLPTTYEALCALYLPRPIRSRSARAKALRYIKALVGYDLTQGQEDYLAVLTYFSHQYEQGLVSAPGLDSLRFDPDRMIAELEPLALDQCKGSMSNYRITRMEEERK
jgi:hypothetical protein